jgi:hypothetical protein
VDTATEKPKRNPKIQAALEEGANERKNGSSANGSTEAARETEPLRESSLSSVDPGEDTVEFMGEALTFSKLSLRDLRDLEREGFTVPDLLEGLSEGRMTTVAALVWAQARRKFYPKRSILEPLSPEDVFDSLMAIESMETMEKIAGLAVKYSRLIPDHPNRTGGNGTESPTEAPSTGSSSLAN